MNKKNITFLALILLVLISGCNTIKDEKIITIGQYYFLDSLNISCSVPENLIAEITKLEWAIADSSMYHGSFCEAITPECTSEIYLFESDSNSLRHRIHYFGSPDDIYYLIYHNRNYRCFKEEVTTMKDNTKDIESSCFSNNECKLVSTNCCPESGGAKWKCINEDKSIISCPEGSGCYQFVSPKPTQNCVCINNQCQQEIPNEKYCEKNDECSKVRAGCCGCGGNGEATAINKDYIDFWGNKLSNECKNVECLLAESDDWTCFADAKCDNGICVLE